MFYLKRLSLLWKSLLNGLHKARATKSFCVPMGLVLSHELSYVMTRKVMMTCLSHHLHSSVEHLYLPCNDAYHGLINDENLFYSKLVVIACHLSSFGDVLVQLCSDLDQLLPPCTYVHSF